MDNSLQFGWRKNGQRERYRREAFLEVMRFELTLEIFRTLESNNVKTLWLEGEYGN